jgi:hypothetical protein
MLIPLPFAGAGRVILRGAFFGAGFLAGFECAGFAFMICFLDL